MADAAARLEKKELTYRTVAAGWRWTARPRRRRGGARGSGGDHLSGRSPAGGDRDSAQLVGLSYETAKKRLEEAGFFMHAVGTSTFYSNTSKAESQSVAAGEPAAIGTVVDVQFATVTEDGYAGIN